MVLISVLPKKAFFNNGLSFPAVSNVTKDPPVSSRVGKLQLIPYVVTKKPEGDL